MEKCWKFEKSWIVEEKLKIGKILEGWKKLKIGEMLKSWKILSWKSWKVEKNSKVKISWKL